METAETIALVRSTLEIAFFLAAPLLAIATAVSVLVNVGQVLTSLPGSDDLNRAATGGGGGCGFAVSALDAAQADRFHARHVGRLSRFVALRRTGSQWAAKVRRNERLRSR